MQIDAALAAKLAAVLKKVAHGKTLAVAAAEAGVGASEVERAVKELERELWARARGAEAPSDPRTRATRPAQKKSKKPARGAKAKKLALIAYADGGSRGNPGRAACGVLITDADGAELLRRAKTLGRTTNNVAEYEGVLYALELCRELGAAHVVLRLDSELVVRQLEGRYKVKHADLAKLHARARAAVSAFETFDVEYIPRAQNAIADKLANAALDGKELD
jgi:ribonuclease HI